MGSTSEVYISRLRDRRRDLVRQIDLMEAGILRTRAGKKDTTQDSIASEKQELAQIEAALSLMGADLVDPRGLSPLDLEACLPANAMARGDPGKDQEE